MKTKNSHNLSGNIAIAEGKKYKTQTRKVLRAFADYPKTMLEVAIETGVLRANICRYISRWRDQDKIKEVGMDECSISKHKAMRFISNIE